MSARKTPKGGSKPSSNGMASLIALIVVGVLVMIVLIIVIWLSTRGATKTKLQCIHNSDCASGSECKNAQCVPIVVPPVPVCTSAPSAPPNVLITFDRVAKTASVTWGAVTGATGYKIYRKLNDPSVSKLSSDEAIATTSTSHAYSSLADGTHYFVVTAINTCGESDESAPVVFAAACDAIPTTPAAPLILTNTNHCSDPMVCETVSIMVDDATGTSPYNILTGTGQMGVDSYFSVLSSPSSPFEANLKCIASPVAYTSIAIADGQQAQLISPTGPMVLAATLDVSWEPAINAEEYAVLLVSVDANGVVMFTGGTVGAPHTHLVVTTPSGSNLIFAQVIAYRLCDKSLQSNPGYHIPPTI